MRIETRTETRPSQVEGDTSSTPTIWPGQNQRKRRDSNPRSLARRSLSRSATDTSAPIVQGVPPGQPAAMVVGDHRRSWANATRTAPVVPNLPDLQAWR